MSAKPVTISRSTAAMLLPLVLDEHARMRARADERTPETHAAYATMLAALISSKGLRAFEREALACVIDQAARAASDAGKLSLHMRSIVDLLQEADYWAGVHEHALVGRQDVQRAIDTQLERAGRVPERLREAIARGDVQIATAGKSVGQGSGLAVFQLGELVFGHPTRISARVRMGRGEVLDIEREVKLGGPLHSKGVLILAGFLSGQYATSVPLTLSATIVFEQSGPSSQTRRSTASARRAARSTTRP